MVLKLGIMDLWTPENHYHWSKSRYGSHVSGRVETVDKSRLLLCSMFLHRLIILQTNPLKYELIFILYGVDHTSGEK